jgi:hypothetical protein
MRGKVALPKAGEGAGDSHITKVRVVCREGDNEPGCLRDKVIGRGEGRYEMHDLMFPGKWNPLFNTMEHYSVQLNQTISEPAS